VWAAEQSTCHCRNRYPAVALYHQRWGIEEDYKVMKSRLTIENFSGFSVEAVLQDIHAKTLTKNLAAVAIIEGRQALKPGRKEAQTSLQT
jgi:hypothetical protein